MTKRSLNNKSIVLFAVLLFLGACAVHMLCGDYPKAIDVLPDERRYLEIARSLFTGNGLIIRGAASTFQKILYPVSLFPALLFPDGVDQVRVIGILNSVYACSSVFPALLIARRIFKDPYVIAACLVLVVITPDLMYSMTFMSESIYLPLALWMVYLCWCCFETEGPRELVLCLVAGVFCYVVYLCKEVAWMFLAAFIAFYFMAAVDHRRSVKRSAAAAALFLAGFLVPFVVMKLTLFAGLSNSYQQLGFDTFVSLYNVLFGLYAVAVDSVYFVVGFGIFPVIYLACTYRGLARRYRDLLQFCFISLVVGLLIVVVSISMREDVGHVALRQHLRYVAPLALPLTMLFIKQVAHFDPTPITCNPRRNAAVVGVTVGFCVLAVAFFGTANLSQGFDFSQFHLMRWLQNQVQPLAQETYDQKLMAMRAISPDDGDLLVINALNWACRALVVAFTAAGMYLLMNANEWVRLRAGAVICLVLGAFMVTNSVAMCEYNRNAYEVDPAEVSQMCAISEELAAVEGNAGPGVEEIVVVLDEENTGYNNMIDTYLQDGAGKYRYLHASSFQMSFAQTAMGAGSSGYLLASTDQDLDLWEYNATPLIGTEEDSFILYRVVARHPLSYI